MSDDMYDRFRALVEGRMPEADAARLRGEIAADATLRAAFDDYAAAHEVAAPAAGAAPPPCRVTFEQVGAPAATGFLHRVRAWHVAAAAVLAAAAGLGAWRALRPDPPAVVELRAITLEPPVAPADVPAVPASLASWRPVEGGKLRWLASLDDARATGRATGRALLLFVYHPTCPMCLQLDRETFPDAGLVAALADFVPVRVNVMEAPEEVQGLTSAGWPYLGAIAADGTGRLDFPGVQGPAELRGHLDEARRTAWGAAVPVPWDRANELAAALARAAEAEKAGRLAEALGAYEEVAARDARGAFGRAAAAGRERIADEARKALLEARRMAETDEAAGARRLQQAAERFRGTHYGSDLALVGRGLRATGCFPVLREAAR